jgi:hypothetical protein
VDKAFKNIDELGRPIPYFDEINHKATLFVRENHSSGDVSLYATLARVPQSGTRVYFKK